jgi:hypothetical protein
MNIQIVTDSIPLSELQTIGKEFYDSMVKGVVDIKKEIVAFGGEFHIDANAVLIQHGSRQSDVWGFNVRFDKPRESWIEYTSLINIRPGQGNKTMEIGDETLRKAVARIVGAKIR